MKDVGTTGVVGKMQPLHLTLPLTQACPSWPSGWSGEEVTHTYRCCWHKKLSQGVWGELAVAGALPTPKHPAVLRHQQRGGYGQQSRRKPGWAQQRAGISARPLSPVMAEGAGTRDKGRSPLQKALPGPGLFDTLLHDPTAARKADWAARLARLHARSASTLPAGWATGRARQPAAVPPSAADGQRAWTHGAHWDEQPDPGHHLPTAKPSPAHSRAGHQCPRAAIAEAPGLGWEETGRDKFISSSVSLFRSHF